jgi:hypothetical protein
MKLWEKQHAYILRRFVMIKVIMVIELARSDQLDHSCLGRVLLARGSAGGLRSWVTAATGSPARLVP